MNVKNFWTTLLRRWYLTLLALAVAVVATYLVVDRIGPTYRAQGGVLFYPPVATTKKSTETLGNPYLQLGGLTQARDVVVRALNAQDTRTDLCAGSAPLYAGMRAGMCGSHPTVSYEAEPDFTNSAPIVLVTAEASSPEDATATLGALLDRTPVVLRSLQTSLGLQDKAMITSATLMVDRKAEVVRKDQIRGGVVAGGGTLALGLVLVALVDGLLVAWRRRRPRVAAAAAPAAELEPDSDWWGTTEVAAAPDESAVSPVVEWDNVGAGRG